jgi:hypothetical protein
MPAAAGSKDPITTNVKILGINELLERTDWDVLVQPEMRDAQDTILKRVKRQGKGLGARRNELAFDVRPLGATVSTSLIYPRTKGTSWGRKNVAAVRAMTPRVLKKAIKRMQERWAFTAGKIL